MDLKKHRKISLVMSFMFIFSIIFSGNTKVQAITEDNIAPVVNNVLVDKREAIKGNTIVVTVDAKDNLSGLAQEANLCYVIKTESGEVEKEIKLSLVDGKYLGEIDIDRNCPLGTWKISFIIVEDKEKNVSIVYNSRVHTKLTSMAATVQNLNGGDFEVLDIEDINAPQFGEITVSDNKIAKYDNVKIVVDASDDLSGLAEEANLCYISKANGKEVEKEISLALVNGKYEKTISIDDSYGTGNWLVSFITMQDKDGNVNVIYNAEVHPKLGQDLSSANLYLNEDIVSPVFEGISVDYNFNVTNSKLNIEVKAAEDNSGLEEEANLCYVSQKDGKAVEREITLELQDGKYVANLVMDDSFQAVNWKVSFITLQDKAGNVAVVYNSDVHPGLGQSLVAADLKLNGDVIPPKFEGISVSGNTAEKYDSVIVEVKATDDVLGLAEEANLCYVSEKSGKVTEKEVTLKLQDGKYIAALEIDNSFAQQEWKVSFITLQDRAGNVTVVYNSDVHKGLGQSLAVADISLDGDIVAPKFEGVTVDYNFNIESDNEIIVEVKATDDNSGLAEEANLFYIAQKDGKVVEKEVALNLKDGKYIGKFKIDESLKTANWRVSFIILEDKTGNVDIIYNSDVHVGLGQSLSSADLKQNVDITAPNFKNLSLYYSYGVNSFDEAIIELKATDDLSGLAEEANLCYVSQNDGKVIEREVTLRLEKGMYVARVSIDDNIRTGNWKVSFITLQDKAGNVAVIYNSDIHPGLGQSLKAADITLDKDITSPEFKEVSVSTNEVDIYDNVVVEVKASDDMSGLAEEANLCYISELDGNVVEKEVTLKLEEGKYVGTFTIDESYGISTWKVNFITLQDKVGNVSIIYNSDIHNGLGISLNKADLSTKVDGAYLTFNKVNVSTHKAFLGDKVEVVVEATDKAADLNETADLCYVLTTPFGDIEREVTLNLIDGKYQGTIDIDQSYYSGLWRISFITIEDKKNNVIVVYNNQLHGSVGMNLSSGDIDTLIDVLVEPLNLEQEFKLGTTAEIKARVTNGLDRVQQVTLIVGLYDNNNRLIKYETISKIIASTESSELVVPISIPYKDVCKLKVFVWDSIEEMTPLSKAREYLVK